MDRLWYVPGINYTWKQSHVPLSNVVGDAEDPVEIKSIDISPDPPKPGQDLTVKVTATVKETIEVNTPYSHRDLLLFLMKPILGGCEGGCSC